MQKEKKTVLVVDDDEDLRILLGSEIEQAGFEVFTAKDGEEGFNLALEKKPDLIMLDLVMPNSDGFEMLERLRNDPWGNSAHIILLTVLEDEKSLARVLEKKGNEYLVKTDWKIKDVVSKIKKVLAE